VALLEPPVGEQRRWRARPYMRTAKLLTDFAFTAPVTTTVTSPDGAPYPWTWPRGDALRSDMLVFEPDESSTPQMTSLAARPEKYRAGLFRPPTDANRIAWQTLLKVLNSLADIKSARVLRFASAIQLFN